MGAFKARQRPLGPEHGWPPVEMEFLATEKFSPLIWALKLTRGGGNLPPGRFFLTTRVSPKGPFLENPFFGPKEAPRGEIWCPPRGEPPFEVFGATTPPGVLLPTPLCWGGQTQQRGLYTTRVSLVKTAALFWVITQEGGKYFCPHNTLGGDSRPR